MGKGKKLQIQKNLNASTLVQWISVKVESSHKNRNEQITGTFKVQHKNVCVYMCFLYFWHYKFRFSIKLTVHFIKTSLYESHTHSNELYLCRFALSRWQSYLHKNTRTHTYVGTTTVKYDFSTAPFIVPLHSEFSFSLVFSQWEHEVLFNSWKSRKIAQRIYKRHAAREEKIRKETTSLKTIGSACKKINKKFLQCEFGRTGKN